MWEPIRYELTRNSSENTQPESSQLAEPLWTDPGLHTHTNTHTHKIKAQVGNELSNILPKSLHMTKKLPPQGDLNFMYGINQAKNNTNRNDITGLGFHIWPISGDTGTGIKLVKMQSKHFQLVTSTAFQRRGLHKIIKHNTGDDASHREACQNTQLCTCKTQKITRIFGEPQTFLHCLIFFFFGGEGDSGKEWEGYDAHNAMYYFLSC